MRQRVVAARSVRSWLVAGVLLAFGCSFDASAIAPGHDARASTDDEAEDAAPRDARTDTPVDSSVPPPPKMDAGPQKPVDPPDAAGLDAGQGDATAEDAAIDAAMDADVDDDAAVDEPDASEPCEHDDDPCVCPHEALTTDDDACAPPLCPISECTPDDDCRFLSFAESSYYFCNDEYGWEQARDRCESIDGDAHLVSLKNAEEDQFVFEEISGKTWMGGDDRGNEGRWRWPDGTAFYDDEDGEVPGTFNNWYAGEPNDQGLSMSDPDCMIYWHENATWADASCGDEHAYVCEID